MKNLSGEMKKGVLKFLQKSLAEVEAELFLTSTRARDNLQQNGHKSLELEDVESTSDVDLTRNIPGLQKRILKLRETIENVETTSEYGTCRECGEEISMGRLLQIPFTDLCVACKERQEEKERRYRRNVKGYVKNNPIYI
jgi:DnaK suppressor protein